MADESQEPGAKPDARRKAAATPRNRAQAEFDRYKTRVSRAAAGAAGPVSFAGPPAFSLGSGVAMPPGWSQGPASMAGSPYGGASPYGGLGFPYGVMAAPPPLPENSLTERLRYTLRLGVDVLNATLSGGLRVLGGAAGAAGWAGGMYASGHGHGHGCGCGHSGCDCQSSCGCDCCSSYDPCCHSGVSSCGCGCC
jgi:hypothetical protein